MKKLPLLITLTGLFIASELQSQSLQESIQAFVYSLWQKEQPVEQAPAIPDASESKIKSIIFDINGVLCTTNELQAAYDTAGAISRFIRELWALPSKKILFDSLKDVPAQSPYKVYYSKLYMPQIMIDWKSGVKTPAEIRQAIMDHFATSQLPDAQKNWALQTALMMTDPERFVKIRKTIPANIALLGALKDKGYKLYVISNWDPNSFTLFQKAFPEVFMYKNKPIFDGIVTSGTAKILKPEPAIFEKCLTDYHINPTHALFIDDEPANITTADKEFGMYTILSNPKDTDKLKADLIDRLQQK